MQLKILKERKLEFTVYLLQGLNGLKDPIIHVGMVTDVYSKIIDEDRRFNAQKMDKEFYSTLNDDMDNQHQDTGLTDSYMALLDLLKSLSPSVKEQLLKQTLQK